MFPVLCIIQKHAQADETAVADDWGPEQSTAGPRDARVGRARKCRLAKQGCASSESVDTAPPRKGRSSWVNIKSTCSNEESGEESDASAGEVCVPQTSSSSPAAESQANDAKVIQPAHLQQQ